MIKVFWSSIVFIVLLLNSCTSILSSGVYSASDSTQGRWPEPLDQLYTDVTVNLWYQPKVGASWHWQLEGNINTNYDVDVYIIDLFDSSAAFINKLHNKERKVICQFSAGKYMPSLPDAHKFFPINLGKPLDNSSNGFWIDIRSENVRQIMQGRLKLATHKNCDGVQLDYMDSYKRDTGFPISLANQTIYNNFLADQAHQRGLGVGFTNNIEQASELVDNFDFVTNEQCHEFDECQELTKFITLGKPVFNAEYLQSYRDNPDLLCPSTLENKFSTLILDEKLDGSFRFSCGYPHFRAY